MSRLHVLHVAGDFPNQHAYIELVSHLDRLGVAQEIYAAVRTAAEAAWPPPALTGARFYTPRLLRPYHRLLFRSKIRRIQRSLERDVPVHTVTVTHAHSIYSDGAVAHRLWQARGMPYLVAVRNGDIHAFMRYRPDLVGLRNAVLRAAGRVVFLSPAYWPTLLEALDPALRAAVEAKALVVPNGVAPEWLAWTPPRRRAPSPDTPLRILYVGDFSANKNVPALIAAVGYLCGTRPARLTLVGGGGDAQGAVANLLRGQAASWVTWVGRINDRAALRDQYRAHDIFAMPSITESFGLAYTEAMSQGLPVVHSHGQGVAGLFRPDTVAEPVDPRDPEAIAAGLACLAARCERVREECVAEATRFNWERIAGTYVTLYEALGRTTGEA